MTLFKKIPMAYLRIIFSILALIIAISNTPMAASSKNIRTEPVHLVDTSGAPYMEALNEIRIQCQNADAQSCKITLAPFLIAANKNWKDYLSLCVPYSSGYIPTVGSTCDSATEALVNSEVATLATKASTTLSAGFLQDLKTFLSSKLTAQ